VNRATLSRASAVARYCTAQSAGHTDASQGGLDKFERVSWTSPIERIAKLMKEDPTKTSSQNRDGRHVNRGSAPLFGAPAPNEAATSPTSRHLPGYCLKTSPNLTRSDGAIFPTFGRAR